MKWKVFFLNLIFVNRDEYNHQYWLGRCVWYIHQNWLVNCVRYIDQRWLVNSMRVNSSDIYFINDKIYRLKKKGISHVHNIFHQFFHICLKKSIETLFYAMMNTYLQQQCQSYDGSNDYHCSCRVENNLKLKFKIYLFF